MWTCVKGLCDDKNDTSEKFFYRWEICYILSKKVQYLKMLDNGLKEKFSLYCLKKIGNIKYSMLTDSTFFSHHERLDYLMGVKCMEIYDIEFLLYLYHSLKYVLAKYLKWL